MQRRNCKNAASSYLFHNEKGRGRLGESEFALCSGDFLSVKKGRNVIEKTSGYRNSSEKPFLSGEKHQQTRRKRQKALKKHRTLESDISHEVETEEKVQQGEKIAI